MTRSEDKAKRDYVRGWESASRRPYPYKDVPTDNPRKRLGPALRIRELWQRDRLGVLGVGSALLAAGLFAAPNIGYDWGISLGAAHWPFDFGFSEWSKDPVEGRTGGWTAWLGAVIVFVQLSVEFTPGPNFSVGTDFYTFFQEWGSRLPAIAALLALSIILLLLRRRQDAGVIELGPFAVSGFLVVLLLRYLILPRLEKWVMTGEWFEQIVRLISHAVDKVPRTGSPSKSGRKYIESEYQKLPWVKSRKDK